jgi:hypothetical protein
MKRVFLIERPRTHIDLTRAEEYGTITLIFDEGDRRCSVFDSVRFGERVVRRLEQLAFDPAQDSLCAAGSLVPVSVALAAMVCYYPTVNVLFYNATESTYVMRTIGKDLWKGHSNESRVQASATEDDSAEVL